MSGLRLNLVYRTRIVVLALTLPILPSTVGRAQVLRVRISSPVAAVSSPPTAARRQRSVTITVDLDEYVEGVLAGEASTLESPQALDAMAVIVRTWALRYRGRHRAQGFDFCTLTHCQVFRRAQDSAGGYSDAVVRAVRDTRDEVLEYEGALVDPYFGADCGGTTESPADVWPDKNLPYLQASPDPYCAGSSHSSWRRVISVQVLGDILRHDMGAPLQGRVGSIEVASRDSSGRARTLTVQAGAPLIIDANQFRYAVGRRLGWDEIKSNLYAVQRRGDEVVFTGRGLGHGVGLCQAGAEEMGRLGINYKKILAQYFPGTTVVQFRSPADPVASSEHFELAYPETQQRWVSESLSELERSRKELAISGSDWPPKIRVQTWDSTADFMGATGQPGWVGGTNDGTSIFLQPLATLAAKDILKATLRHEVAHVAVHRLRARAVPSWFEEGLVLHLTGEQVDADSHPASSGRTLGEAIARSKSEAEMREAYARASLLVRELARGRGEEALWQVLEHPTRADLEWLTKESDRPLGP